MDHALCLQGMTLEKAREILLEDVNYFGTVMVAAGDADGMVSGAIHTTSNTVRPALQIIKVSNQNCSGFTVYSLVFCLLSHSIASQHHDCVFLFASRNSY